MKQKLLCLLSIILFCGSACSKEQLIGVLDDISRDTYEKKAREQHIDNLGNPAYEASPTYDQYQRERNKFISTQEEAPSKEEKDQ
jgi:hypothetical protein